MDQPTLFEVDERQVCSGPHVLMPDMAYACGGSILTKTGGFMFLTATNHADVGCPDCAALDPQALLDEQRAAQGRQA